MISEFRNEPLTDFARDDAARRAQEEALGAFRPVEVVAQEGTVVWARAGAPVTAVDVLPDPAIRRELSALSGWPTIPQVFVRGELLGGADIVEELEASGELERKLEAALGPGYRDGRTEKVVALV